MCCFLVACCFIYRRDQKQKQANIRVKDLLLNAAAFKINPNNYEVGDACPICIIEFDKDQNVICLPCNRGHMFHPECIGSWVEINNCCPICKAPVTKEAIEGAEMQDIPNNFGEDESRPLNPSRLRTEDNV